MNKKYSIALHLCYFATMYAAEPAAQAPDCAPQTMALGPDLMELKGAVKVIGDCVVSASFEKKVRGDGRAVSSEKYNAVSIQDIRTRCSSLHELPLTHPSAFYDFYDSLQWHPTQQELLVGGYYQPVQHIDVKTNVMTLFTKNKILASAALAWSPNGELVALAAPIAITGIDDIFIMRGSTRQTVYTIKSSELAKVAWKTDNELIVANNQGSVKCVTLDGKKTADYFSEKIWGKQIEVVDIKAFQENQYAVSAEDKIKLFDNRQPEPCGTLYSYGRDNKLLWLSDTSLVAAGAMQSPSKATLVALWDIRKASRVNTRRASPCDVRSLAAVTLARRQYIVASDLMSTNIVIPLEHEA